MVMSYPPSDGRYAVWMTDGAARPALDHRRPELHILRILRFGREST
jgi:hypothetical protein